MKNLLILLLFATSSYSKGQSPDYYVYLVKGDATVAKPGVKPIPVKQNTFIDKTSIINLKNGAEIMLVDKDQKFLVVKSPGNNYVGDLAKDNSLQNYTGITQKYLQLLWNELLHPDYDYAKFKKENLAGAYGGVSRGDQCNNLIFPINGLKTSGDALHFKWHKTSPSSKYTFFIYDSEGKDVSKIAIKDTQLSINTTQFSGSKTGKYYWLVKSDDATCEDEVPIYFELMTKDDEAKLISSLVTVTGNKDLQNKFQIIEALEKKGMIYAATDFYQNLIKENPGDEALRKSCVLFLLKYGFNEEAMVAWNARKK